MAARSIGLVLGLLLLAFSGNAQQPTTNDVRFLAVDIFMDSKGRTLAAYQLEFSVTNGNAKIIGIEGGEHPAFSDPPHYDPKALQQERVIIAEFSTEPADKLPSVKTRVATIHLRVVGPMSPQLALKPQAAVDSQGNSILAESVVQERRTK